MLDIEQSDALIAYLRASSHIAPVETPVIHNLAGGVSNRTVLVERENGEAWVMKQALEKLRVQVDWFSSTARIHREAAGLRWMQATVPDYAPPLVFEDETEHLLAMIAVPQPHINWKTQLLQGVVNRAYVAQFGWLLGSIQRLSLEHEGTADLFTDRGFFETLRLEPYYSYAASQVAAAAPFIHTLIEDTRARRLTLVHGDYSPKNVLVYDDRLILLDYEVIHWGDPAFDPGFSLTHFLSKAHALPEHRATFASAANTYWASYWDEVAALPFAAGLEARAIRHTLACLLARVAGRSPLEYLNADQRAHQQAVVVNLMTAAPDTIAELIGQFAALI
ncbi:MAG: aminoglycoside phosphotransferase family protein [Chloroflexi bacterium]|nr:aminoglycoside phosphotransferase family protein [Chloroflexota bacterium]MCC6892821.1 aminoglycoside phosphotransferase family protein [Anaerolineae bacterium]